MSMCSCHRQRLGCSSMFTYVRFSTTAYEHAKGIVRCGFVDTVSVHVACARSWLVLCGGDGSEPATLSWCKMALCRGMGLVWLSCGGRKNADAHGWVMLCLEAMARGGGRQYNLCGTVCVNRTSRTNTYTPGYIDENTGNPHRGRHETR